MCLLLLGDVEENPGHHMTKVSLFPHVFNIVFSLLSDDKH